MFLWQRSHILFTQPTFYQYYGSRFIWSKGETLCRKHETSISEMRKNAGFHHSTQRPSLVTPSSLDANWRFITYLCYSFSFQSTFLTWYPYVSMWFSRLFMSKPLHTIRPGEHWSTAWRGDVRWLTKHGITWRRESKCWVTVLKTGHFLKKLWKAFDGKTCPFWEEGGVESQKSI